MDHHMTKQELSNARALGTGIGVGNARFLSTLDHCVTRPKFWLIPIPRLFYTKPNFGRPIRRLFFRDQIFRYQYRDSKNDQRSRDWDRDQDFCMWLTAFRCIYGQLFATFGKDQIFWDRYETFFREQIFWYQYRDFFNETKFSDTDTETFFRDQIFWYRYRDYKKNSKSLETTKSRDRDVTLCYGS